jgi:hypothetical protein
MHGTMLVEYIYDSTPSQTILQAKYMSSCVSFALHRSRMHQVCVPGNKIRLFLVRMTLACLGHQVF